MLKSLSVAFQTDECFRLCPEEIAKDGSSPLSFEKKLPLAEEDPTRT